MNIGANAIGAAMAATRNRSTSVSKQLSSAGRLQNLKVDEASERNVLKQRAAGAEVGASNAENRLVTHISRALPKAVEIQEVLEEMQSIVEQGANGVLTNAEIAAQLQPSHNALLARIDDIVLTTMQADGATRIFRVVAAAGPPPIVDGPAVAVPTNVDGTTVNIPEINARTDDAAGLGDIAGTALDSTANAQGLLPIVEGAISRITGIIATLNLASRSLSNAADASNAIAGESRDAAAAIESVQYNETSALLNELLNQIGVLQNALVSQANQSAKTAAAAERMLSVR